MKVIVIDDEVNIREVLCAILEADFPDIEFLSASNGREGLELLEFNDDIEVIISDYKMPELNGGDIFEYNKSHKNLPFILMTGGYLEEYDDLLDFYKVNPLNTFLNKPIRFDDLSRELRKILREIGEFDKVVSEASYMKVSVNFLKKYFLSRADLYLRVSENNFVKIFNRNGEDLFSILEKYKTRGEDSFYIETEDFRSLVSKTLNDLFKKSLWDKAEGSLEVVSICAKKLNFSYDEMKSIDRVVDSITHDLNKLKTFDKEIKKLQNGGRYFLAHSKMAIYISYCILRELERSEESIIRKFVYAGLLHDSFLQNEDLSSYYYEDDEFKALSNEEREEVFDHAKKAAEFVKEHNTIPSDVIEMVLYHHENFEESGFPFKLQVSKLNFLSSVFLLSVQVAHHFYFSPIDHKELKERLERTPKDIKQRKYVDIILSFIS